MEKEEIKLLINYILNIYELKRIFLCALCASVAKKGGK